jgi:hypothetical protein
VVAPGKLETERKEVEEKPPVSEVEQLGPVKIRAHKNEINENTGFPTSEALGFKPAKPQPIAKSIISNVSSIVQSFTVNLGFVIESEPVLAGLTVNDIDELLKHIRKTQAWLGTVENNFIKLMEEKQ